VFRRRVFEKYCRDILRGASATGSSRLTDWSSDLSYGARDFQNPQAVDCECECYNPVLCLCYLDVL
jgi:hypothetical protein